MTGVGSVFGMFPVPSWRQPGHLLGSSAEERTQVSFSRPELESRQ